MAFARSESPGPLGPMSRLNMLPSWAGGTACLIVEAVLKRAFSKSLLGAVMWDQIQRRDVEVARQKLAELRSTTIQRHAEDLNSSMPTKPRSTH